MLRGKGKDTLLCKVKHFIENRAMCTVHLKDRRMEAERLRDLQYQAFLDKNEEERMEDSKVHNCAKTKIRPNHKFTKSDIYHCNAGRGCSAYMDNFRKIPVCRSISRGRTPMESVRFRKLKGPNKEELIDRGLYAYRTGYTRHQKDYGKHLKQRNSIFRKGGKYFVKKTKKRLKAEKNALIKALAALKK